MTAATLNLTPARRRALVALAATHPRPGRYSNVTEITGGDKPRIALVRWQAADWLTALGLVDVYGDKVTLTATGLATCDDAGIAVGA